LTVLGVTLDEQRQCVCRDNADISLTGGEFRLLRYFMLHPGRLVSRDQLVDHLYDIETERHSNVIEVHIKRLRDKLGRNVIETRRGQGYCFLGASA
jgi:DNA-binding response OmpR family regulator